MPKSALSAGSIALMTAQVIPLDTNGLIDIASMTSPIVPLAILSLSARDVSRLLKIPGAAAIRTTTETMSECRCRTNPITTTVTDEAGMTDRDFFASLTLKKRRLQIVASVLFDCFSHIPFEPRDNPVYLPVCEILNEIKGF
jgi:hypothetical protein